jgi:hypothetical protein
MQAMVSGMFGIIAAMRSPSPTPGRGRPAAAARPALRARPSSSAGRACPRRGTGSPVRISGAGQQVLGKIQPGIGKNRAPGMASPFSRMRSPLSPRTPQKSHSADQKPSRSVTDHPAGKRIFKRTDRIFRRQTGKCHPRAVLQVSADPGSTTGCLSSRSSCQFCRLLSSTGVLQCKQPSAFKALRDKSHERQSLQLHSPSPSFNQNLRHWGGSAGGV